jgi:hypothetical protein
MREGYSVEHPRKKLNTTDRSSRGVARSETHQAERVMGGAQ